MKIVFNVFFLVLMSRVTLGQIVGIWIFSMDAVFEGVRVKGSTFYTFTSQDKIFYFSTQDEIQTPKMLVYSILKKDKERMITRYESSLTDLYNSEDITNRIYTGNYQDEAFDTIQFKVLSSRKMAIEVKRAKNNRIYKRLSKNDYNNLDTSALNDIRRKLKEIDIGLQKGLISL